MFRICCLKARMWRRARDLPSRRCARAPLSGRAAS